MKTFLLIVIYILMTGTVVAQKIIPVNLYITPERRLGEDTIKRLQYFSPIDITIILEPVEKGVEVKKNGYLKTLSEIITIRQMSKGVMLPIEDIDYDKDPKTDNIDKKAGIKRIRVSFDEKELSNFLTFQLDIDGKFRLLCQYGGIVMYGKKLYKIRNYPSFGYSCILYMKNIFETNKRRVKGRKVNQKN